MSVFTVPRTPIVRNRRDCASGRRHVPSAEIRGHHTRVGPFDRRPRYAPVLRPGPAPIRRRAPAGFPLSLSRRPEVCHQPCSVGPRPCGRRAARRRSRPVARGAIPGRGRCRQALEGDGPPRRRQRHTSGLAAGSSTAPTAMNAVYFIARVSDSAQQYEIGLHDRHSPTARCGLTGKSTSVTLFSRHGTRSPAEIPVIRRRPEQPGGTETAVAKALTWTSRCDRLTNCKRV